MLHADTDSVIYIGPDPEDILPIGKELGDWSNEEVGKSPIKTYIEGGVKRYIKIRENGQIDVTFAGLPQKTENGLPVGAWVELLDCPERALEDNAVFGDAHYYIKSDWLRQNI